nr:hypothetical protein CFP56_70589 [Quercus suber]
MEPTFDKSGYLFRCGPTGVYWVIYALSPSLSSPYPVLPRARLLYEFAGWSSWPLPAERHLQSDQSDQFGRVGASTSDIASCVLLISGTFEQVFFLSVQSFGSASPILEDAFSQLMPGVGIMMDEITLQCIHRTVSVWPLGSTASNYGDLSFKSDYTAVGRSTNLTMSIVAMTCYQ